MTPEGRETARALKILPLFHLPGHCGNIVALAYDPNGRYLASAGSDQIVDVWDLDSVRGQLAKLGLAW